MFRKILYCLISLVFATNIGYSQGIPSLNDLVKNIQMVSLPSKGYKVSVAQTVTTSSTKSSSQSLSTSAMNGQPSFNYVYSPKSRLQISSANNLRSGNAQSSNTQQSQSPNTQQANTRVAFDLAKLLKNFNEWERVKIVGDELNGENCYKISAQDKSYEYIIWVDVANYYVPKIILNINGNEFAEINITYRHTSKYWLPSKFVINHAVDGSQITQSFGEYVFE